MQLHFYNLKAEVVCGFMTENGKPKHGVAYNEYMPIIKELEFKSTTEIKMIHESNVDLNIEEIDNNNTNKKLNQNVKIAKKIDVTANDVNLGGTELIFNFTDMNIVIYNRNNIPVMFTPLENKILKDKYKGLILFMTIHRLNNPQTVNDIYNNPVNKKNYLKVLKDGTRFKSKINDKFDEFTKVIEFADEYWDQVSYMDADYRCNSIKVVTMASISVDKLTPGNSDSYSSMIISNKGMLITRDTMFAYKENPHMYNEIDLTQFKNEVFPGNKIIYIVDNDNELTDRFYTAYGETNKILNIKSKQAQINGLYVVKINDDFTITPVNYVKLEDIDKEKWIYKTKEEAENGADKATIFAKQIKENELNLQNSILQSKAIYEKTIFDLKQESEKIKTESEQNKKEIEKEILNIKRDYQQEYTNNKINYEKKYYENKNSYEENSYKRSTAMESLKIVGAVCGLAATGFVIYKQLQKD